MRVLVFGSTVMGLGFKSSDVDFFIELPRWLHPPQRSFVLEARNILTRHSRHFCKAFAIVHAKVPIVTGCHVPTDTSCDISFNSGASLANSKLLAHLLQSDRRVLQLAVLVKYWSKIHNLTGTNLISSYCLTLLVVFFLQQNNILHSVEELQKNIEDNCINAWNSAFGSPASTSGDNKSMYELLGEFFNFYKTFEFNKYIVSPYLGRPISRELFKKVETVPLSFSRYKNNVGVKNLEALRLDSVMCVQDPFEHNRNCAVAVYAKLAERITTQIQTAVSIYKNENKSDFLKKLLQVRTPDNSPAVKKQKNRPALHGVTKNYRRNQNLKQTRQNIRQNYHRGRNNRYWRGN